MNFCHLNRSSVWQGHLKYFYTGLSSTALFIPSSVAGNTFFFLATQVNGPNSAPCLDALRPDVLTPAHLFFRTVLHLDNRITYHKERLSPTQPTCPTLEIPMTCCSPSRAAAMDPLMRHPMLAAVVAAAVAVGAVASLAARAEAAVLNDHRAPSLRSAHPQGAQRQRKHRRRGRKAETKLSPKMRVKRESQSCLNFRHHSYLGCTTPTLAAHLPFAR